LSRASGQSLVSSPGIEEKPASYFYLWFAAGI
jgi:hypothetical protein